VTRHWRHLIIAAFRKQPYYLITIGVIEATSWRLIAIMEERLGGSSVVEDGDSASVAIVKKSEQ